MNKVLSRKGPFRLHLAKRLGLFRLSRRLYGRRLNILMYHGFSNTDEHLFRDIFMSPECFRERLECLKDWGFKVVGLEEAIDRMEADTLEHHSVVITFDDGFHSTLTQAAPLLKEYGYPATVYVTTYYVEHSNPIFRLAVQYAFWRTSSKSFCTDDLIPGTSGQAPTKGVDSDRIMWDLIDYGEKSLTELQRLDLLHLIGRRLEVDIEALVEARTLSLLTPEELKELVRQGFDLQLHTHRHEIAMDAESIRREITENRAILEPIAGKPLNHFCYPSGAWSSKQWEALIELGIKSATTTDDIMNFPGVAPLGLGRHGDSERASLIEFEAEIVGFRPLKRKLRKLWWGFRDGVRELLSKPKRENVLIANWTLRIGGVERKIADLSRYLSDGVDLKDRDVYLVLAETPPHDPKKAIFFDQVRESVITPLYRPQFWYRGIHVAPSLYLFWQILTKRPVVLLVFLRQLSLSALAARTLLWWRNTTIIVCDDCHTSRSIAEHSDSPLEASTVSYLIRKLYPKADLVVSPSDSSKQDLIENFGVPSKKIAVIKNWVLDLPPPPSVPQQYDLIYVGRIEPVKNLTFLVEVIRDLCRVNPELRACIVGGGSEMDHIHGLCQKYGLESNIHFTDFQKDVGRYLSVSKVFCITSHHEGLPLTVLEAMSHGLPVVARAYEGAEELVKENKTGYVCEDKEQCVDRIQRLLDDQYLRERLGEQARTFVKANHGEENIKKYVDFLLGPRGHR
jgi:glycosyltransferase involved in cell wall biosynthesis/peptidoglycan/xylan/chitin deacetylase (PgdA/CDA1 family)